MLRIAVITYTRPDRPRGCMVVSAATNCSPENRTVMNGHSEHRRARNRAILDRLHKALEEGELLPGADTQALADYFGTLMSGLSAQARGGVSRSRLLATIPASMSPIELSICRSEPSL
jgi:hypothetical protein